MTIAIQDIIDRVKVPKILDYDKRMGYNKGMDISKAAAALGKRGGKAGTGESKRRKTSFDSERSRAALKARWKNHKKKGGVK